MPRKNRKKAAYKPVETRDIAESEYNHLKENPEEIVNTQNNNCVYIVAGNCRVTKTGNSLGLDIIINGEHHYYTILKVHIDALFNDNMKLAHIREYPSITNTSIEQTAEGVD